jgi:hypothetical protein
MTLTSTPRYVVSYQIVENMRMGMTPRAACAAALARLAGSHRVIFLHAALFDSEYP